MLKFLLIFFIIVYLIGYLGRIFLKNWLRKMSGQNNQQYNYKQKPEGEVTVDTNPKNSKKGKFKDGEYVDFEEIKE